MVVRIFRYDPNDANRPQCVTLMRTQRVIGESEVVSQTWLFNEGIPVEKFRFNGFASLKKACV